MARFDYYRGEDGLAVDVQHDHVATNTRVVTPLLLRRRAPPATEKLHPVLLVEGEEYLLWTQALVAVPRTDLGMPLGSLKQYEEPIKRDLDFLLIAGY